MAGGLRLAFAIIYLDETSLSELIFHATRFIYLLLNARGSKVEISFKNVETRNIL